MCFLLMMIWFSASCQQDDHLLFDYSEYFELSFLYMDFDESLSCLKALTGLFGNIDITKSLQKLITKPGSTGKSNQTEHQCSFVYDKIYVTKAFNLNNAPSKFRYLKNSLSSNWQCSIPAFSVCNNKSECLTDECGCFYDDHQVFFCSDGSGCLTFDKVCDGIRTCDDASDELLCEGHYEVSCPTITSNPVVISDLYYCIDRDFYTTNCCGIRDPGNCTTLLKAVWPDYYNPIHHCLSEAVFSELIDTSSYEFELIPLFCAQNCSDVAGFEEGNWMKFCSSVYSGMTSTFTSMLDFVFHCDGEPFGRESHYISVICDGKVDCSNGTDEVGCPGKFYCIPNSSTEMIAEDQVCDNYKDCSNGWDECQEKCFNSVLSSPKLLISSTAVFVLTVCSGLIGIALNCAVGYRCYISNPTSNAAKVDRILCLQVFFFDFLMGVYLCAIVVSSVVLSQKGDYCVMDWEWRSSIVCPILGILFSVASHGSLMAIAFISIIRCLVCTRDVSYFSQYKVVLISGILVSLNLIHASIPLIPIYSVQNVFRTNIFLVNPKSNPFISSNLLNKSRIDEIHLKYFKNNTNFYRTIENLNTITSGGNIFDLIEIGYYGYSAMCIHNIFKNNDSYFKYKLFYIISLSMLLLIFAFTYLRILIKKIITHRNVKKGIAAGNVRNKLGHSMGIKIILMIGSELISWILLISTTIYYQVLGQSPGPLIFEVFALLVIPINSLLNPLFYSKTYTKLATVIQKSVLVRTTTRSDGRNKNMKTRNVSQGIARNTSSNKSCSSVAEELSVIRNYSVYNKPVKYQDDIEMAGIQVHHSDQNKKDERIQNLSNTPTTRRTCENRVARVSSGRRSKSQDMFQLISPPGSEALNNTSENSKPLLQRNQTM